MLGIKVFLAVVLFAAVVLPTAPAAAADVCIRGTSVTVGDCRYGTIVVSIDLCVSTPRYSGCLP